MERVRKVLKYGMVTSVFFEIYEALVSIMAVALKKFSERRGIEYCTDEWFYDTILLYSKKRMSRKSKMQNEKWSIGADLE